MTIIFILLILFLSMFFIYAMVSITDTHEDETDEEFMQRMKKYEDNKKSQE